MTTIISSSKIKNLKDTILLLSSSGNDISINGVLSIEQTKIIAEALKTNTVINSFSLESCGIGDDGATAIAKVLEENHVITSVNLGYNNIGAVGAIKIARALKTNPAIAFLNLEYNRIGDDGAIAIAEALKINHAIISLNLGINNIGAVGATEIAGALEINRVIAFLDLGYNNIGDAGATAIAGALKTNPAITFLGLNSNEIREAGATEIAGALEINRVIAFLDLGYNNIGDGGATAIAGALKTNPAITFLGLSNNWIGDDGATAIAKVLEENHVIIRIGLRRNNIGAVGAKAMAKSLKTNYEITCLDLANNKIGVVRVTAVAEVVKINFQFLCKAIDGFHKNKLISSDQFITLRTHLKILSIYDYGIKGVFYSSEYYDFYKLLKTHDVNDNNLYYVLIKKLSTSIFPQPTNNWYSNLWLTCKSYFFTTPILDADDVSPAALINLDYDVWGNILGYLSHGDINSLACVVLPKRPTSPYIASKVNLINACEAELTSDIALIANENDPSADYAAIASSTQHMLRFAPTLNYLLKIYGIELPQIPFTSEIRFILDFGLGVIRNNNDELIPRQTLESASYYAGMKTVELLNNNPVTKQPTDLISLLKICIPELANGAVAGMTFMDPFAIGFGLVSGAAQCLSKHNLLNKESQKQAMTRFSLDNVVVSSSLVDMCYNGATIDKFLSLINNVVMTDIATKLAFSAYEIPLSGHNIESELLL